MCTEGAAVDRAAAIAEEVRLLERYVLGDDRVYDVRRSGDCFELALRVRLPAPPYGRSAMFCFDRVTLAPVRVELRRDEGTEVLRATSHSADVGDEDLEPTTP